MTERPDEDDPVEARTEPDEEPDEEPDGEWVLLADAAAGVGCTESWLMDRCRDGRLPSRLAPSSPGLLVPLGTVRALVAGRISE